MAGGGSRRRAGLVAGAGVVALVLAACSSSSSTSSSRGASGSSSPKLSGTLVVFAATSLTDAFDKIGTQFHQANPGVTVKFNYNGSSSLATSINQGAPADVFASAAPANMKTVTDASNAARSRRRSSPATRARSWSRRATPTTSRPSAELANPAVKVVVCAPEVPCGAVATAIFKNADVTVKPVSEETNVGGVVTKVTLGEADAGIVYVTDAKANGGKATGRAHPGEPERRPPSTRSRRSRARRTPPRRRRSSATCSAPTASRSSHSFGFLPPGERRGRRSQAAVQPAAGRAWPRWPRCSSCSR